MSRATCRDAMDAANTPHRVYKQEVRASLIAACDILSTVLGTTRRPGYPLAASGATCEDRILTPPHIKQVE